MNNHEDLRHALGRPFPADKIQWRPGATQGNKALALAYVDARLVACRLDDVVGPFGWSAEYREVAARIVCRLTLRIGEESQYKEDGAGDRPQQGGITESDALKGGLSDAFKRAAAAWGVGRYLYFLPALWVPCEKGRLQSVPELPAWATPEGYDRALARRTNGQGGKNGKK